MVEPTEMQAGAAKPRYIRYHPVIGGQYDPGARITFSRPDGGSFEVRVNAGGIRSNREYDFAKPKGTYRILVFGDSQSDGAFQPNELRFSELMEKRNPSLEVINLSLPGAGTDQQLLNFEETGVKYEHDLVLLLPFLVNIRRNVSQTRASIEPSGRIVVRAKPWFELITRADGSEELKLHNVPVPEQPLWVEEPDAEADATPISWLLQKLENARETAKRSRRVRRLAYSLGPLLDVLGRTPYPEYRTPDRYEWRLMAALIRRFTQGLGRKPLVIAPLVDSWYMRFAAGKDYWRRFSSLVDGEKIQTIDLLPHFLKLDRKAHDCFFESDPHLSDLGHVVLADAIEFELRRLQFLPK